MHKKPARTFAKSHNGGFEFSYGDVEFVDVRRDSPILFIFFLLRRKMRGGLKGRTTGCLTLHIECLLRIYTLARFTMNSE